MNALTDIVLENREYRAEFSSARGATCFRLLHKPSGRDILRTPNSEDELRQNVFLYGNPALFPPNRIRGGSFTFEGRDYRFPLNEPQNNCHLHGALYEKPFSAEKVSKSRVVFRFAANSGEYLGFPHAFEIVRKYVLDREGLTEEFSVKNCSENNMPFMLAFHTTFIAEECSLKQRVGREQLRDGHFLPIGDYASGRARDRAISAGAYLIGQEHLSALYEAEDGTAWIRDLYRDYEIMYTMSDEYRYRMIFAPKDAGYICLEPQTCLIDCFHLNTPPEQNGLIVLAPHESRLFYTKIQLKRKR